MTYAELTAELDRVITELNTCEDMMSEATYRATCARYFDLIEQIRTHPEHK